MFAMDVLRVATIQRAPFVFQDESGNFKGSVFEFVNALSKKYNFNYTTSLPPDGQWGRKLLNGSFVGMMGMLVKDEADMAASSITVTDERHEASDFLSPFHEEPSGIILPDSVKSNVKLFSLHRPFQGEVWAALIVCILIEITVVSVILKVHHDQTKLSENTFRATNLSLCTLVNQDCCDDDIREDSLRVSLSLYWMITFVLNQAYMSLMVAFLLAPTGRVSIRSLADLVGQTRIRWTYQLGTAHDSLFDPHVASLQLYKEVGLKAAPLVATPEEGFKLVLKKNMAFIKDKSWLEFQVATECEERSHKSLLAEETFFPVVFSIGLKKGSKHYEKFNHFNLVCHELGLWIHWKAMYWKDIRKSCGKVDEQVKRESSRILVRLDDLEYIYYFYFGLVFVCTSSLVGEILTFIIGHIAKRKKMRRDITHIRVINFPVTNVKYQRKIIQSKSRKPSFDNNKF